MKQDKRTEALNLLGPVYARFTEGLNTPDLKNAKILFTELSEVTTSQAKIRPNQNLASRGKCGTRRGDGGQGHR